MKIFRDVEEPINQSMEVFKDKREYGFRLQFHLKEWWNIEMRRLYFYSSINIL